MTMTAVQDFTVTFLAHTANAKKVLFIESVQIPARANLATFQNLLMVANQTLTVAILMLNAAITSAMLYVRSSLLHHHHQFSRP